MSDDFYRQFETPLDKAVEKVIEEGNQAFLADPEAQARAQEIGDRWRQIDAAERAAGHHAVVLPMATAEALAALLRGEPTTVEEFSPGLTTRMLEQRIAQAKGRA